jgi:hypothetical protein
VATVNIRMTRLFFDRPKVLRKMGKGKAKCLSLVGRDVQQQGRKLLGRKTKRAKPRPAGKPPRVHVDDNHWATLRRILYHASGRDSVIIGPVQANQVQQDAIDLGSKTVPEIQEKGGVVNIQEEQFKSAAPDEWRRRDLRFNPRPWKRYRTRRAKYDARPFMDPSLEKVMERYRKRGRMPGLTIGPSSSVTIGPVGGVA